MSNDDIFTGITEVFGDLFDVPVESITPDISPDTLLEWDSLAHVQLVAALEEKFSVIFTPDMQAEMLNVDLIQDTIQELKNK